MRKQIINVSVLAIATMLLTACGMSPAPKPDTGPAGKVADVKNEQSIFAQFKSPPEKFYDLEKIAGTIFEGISQNKWPQAQAGLSELQLNWQQLKAVVGNDKIPAKSDEALEKLAVAINEKNALDAYENLNAFMDSMIDICKNYKLSPLADIVKVGNSIRNIDYYVRDNDWLKAGAKARELANNWDHAKPSLEQFGILGAITKTHSAINQLRDAVATENKSDAKAKIADLNKSLGEIREYYRGR